MIVERYDPVAQPVWDDFIGYSCNAPFLFRRAYMDYHRDRFEDHSLIVRSMDGNIAAVLPAHRRDSLLSSHGGLTYGGFAVTENMKVSRMLAVFASTIEYLQKNGFTEFLYKTVPYIYHTAPAEGDRYALYLCGAEWYLSSPTTVISRENRLAYQERRTRGVKRAEKHGIRIRETEDFGAFWTVLEENLRTVHKSKPVHSLDEILRLKRYCPENIRLFASFEQDTMLAGAVIYQSKQVAHAQYISSSDRGRETGALDLLFHTLLADILGGLMYFDFGSSSEGHGVNAGLIEQKESFGGRAVAQDWYRVDVTRVRVSDLHAALV